MCVKGASSRIAKVSVSTKNNQHSQIRMFLFLIQVQAVLYAVISATSYYQFRDSTPFKLAYGIST